jgi:hypothetical protein
MLEVPPARNNEAATQRLIEEGATRTCMVECYWPGITEDQAKVAGLLGFPWVK